MSFQSLDLFFHVNYEDIGNLQLNNNSIIAINHNGGIELKPNGTGEVTIDSTLDMTSKSITNISSLSTTTATLGNLSISDGTISYPGSSGYLTLSAGQEVVVDSILNLGGNNIVNASILPRIRTILSGEAYFLQNTDDIMMLDSNGSATIQVNLPASSGADKKFYYFKDLGNASNFYTDLVCIAGNQIDGNQYYRINVDHESVTIYPYGSNWYII